MGLFGGTKKLCPICQNPAARMLPTKVEGQPLCGDCAKKASQLPDNRNAKNMTVEEFRAFITFYDGNASLRSAFRESYRYDFGIFGGSVSLDARRRLLKFSTADNALVFEASNLRSFCVLEDGNPLFEGTRDGLFCHQSAIPDRVRNLGPEIDRFLREQRQYEQMEQMDRMLERKAGERGESYSSSYYPRPDVDRLKPFEKFYLRIELDHPYWSGNEYAQGAPDFLSIDPSITSYLREYETKTGELHELAVQLMAVLSPGAPERRVNSQAVSNRQIVSGIPSGPVDAVTEIQRYKSLLDSGVITEDEFAAKKRQLLGV